jgi:hypothetical protein
VGVKPGHIEGVSEDKVLKGYVDRRGMKWQESGDNYAVGGFEVRTIQVLSEWWKWAGRVARKEIWEMRRNSLLA